MAGVLFLISFAQPQTVPSLLDVHSVSQFPTDIPIWFIRFSNPVCLALHDLGFKPRTVCWQALQDCHLTSGV